MNEHALAQLLFPQVTETPEDLERRYPPRDLPAGAIVTRMAPSPTGFVHLGNLVQGLVAERMAHQSGGVLFLRVEDTDAKREVPGAVEVLIQTLQHYGIHFDEGVTIQGDSGIYGPYRQRQRAEIYHVYAKELVQKGFAYPCFCTEEELAAMRQHQEEQKVNFGYYGPWAVWRDRSMEDVRTQLAAGRPWVLRFRSTGSTEHKFKYRDLVKGELTVTENDIDQILLKSDGIPTYHFAHAVDDHLMRTTHVVRGDEWLSTLPFHIQLFQALGFKLPKYVHIGPLMKMDGNSKRKLSKRKDPELALTYYRAEGFSTAAMREYLMTVLNSNFEDWRMANPTAPMNDFQFTTKKMSNSGSLFDIDKLKDVSKNTISVMSADEVYNEVTTWAKDFDQQLYSLLTADEQKAKAIFAIGRGGAKPRKDLAVWSEVKDYVAFFYEELFTPATEYPENISKEDTLAILNQYKGIYSAADDGEVWFNKVREMGEALGFAGKPKDYKKNPDQFKGHVGDVSQVIRLAITGRTNSPDLCSVMQILGEETCQQRLAQAIETIEK